MPDPAHIAAIAATAAAALAAGIPVVPLLGPGEGDEKARGKAPRIADWTHRQPAEKILATIRANPGSNLGLVCGILSGLICIDVDPRNGGDRWLAEHHERLMDAGAIVAHTGGGGVHLFFAHPGGWIHSRCGKEGIAPGVELKADGGQQVVIAPSIHKTGRKYEWNPAGMDLPLVATIACPLPAWIATAGSAPAARDRRIADSFSDDPADVATAVRRLLALPPAIEGQGGDAATYKAAMVGRDLGLSPDVFLPLFLEHFAARCEPPWSDAEAAAKLRNAYRYAKAPAGAVSVAEDFSQEAITPERIPPGEEPTSATISAESAGLTSWDDGLARAKSGTLLPLPFVLAALLRDRIPPIDGHPKALAGIVGLNELSGELVFLRDTPWGAKAGKILGESDAIRCGEWLGATLDCHPSKGVLWDALESAAADFAFHPIRDWLATLRWDGKPRIGSWLTDFFGAVQSSLHSEMGRRWMISAVARAMKPGCKADYMLVLEGPQGRKKSTGLAALVGPEWFSDDFDASLIGDKDAVAKLRAKWVVEMPEAVAVRKADADALKGYLSRTCDRVRLPFQRRAADFPRQSVFCSTTNRLTYLGDESGARRFWCVRALVRFPFVMRDEIAIAREQLWAEAKYAFDQGEAWHLDAGAEAGAAVAAGARYVADPWETRLAEWLAAAAPPTPSLLDAWHAVSTKSGGDLAHLDARQAGRLRAAMGRLGWECSPSQVFFQGF